MFQTRDSAPIVCTPRQADTFVHNMDVVFVNSASARSRERTRARTPGHVACAQVVVLVIII